MSRSSTRRSWVIGVMTMSGLLLALVSVGSAQAAQTVAWAPAKTTPSKCVIKGYRPNKVVVGSTPVKKTVTVKVTGCTPYHWSLDIDALSGWVQSETPSLVIDPADLSNGSSGSGYAYVWVVSSPSDGSDPSAGLDTTFTILRRATFGPTVNAAPEPTKKGETLTISGRLKRVDWTEALKPYQGYAKQKVLVQFQAKGAKTYTTVKTVRTAEGGKVSTKVAATESGTWRLHYGGNSTTGPANSTGDDVTVG